MHIGKKDILAFALLAIASCPAVSEERPSPTDSSPVVISSAQDAQAVETGPGNQGEVVSSTERDNCWERAAARYRVDAWLLYAIAVRESSLNPRAFNRNKDGSYDQGLMQINSQHLPELARMGISAESLWEPCLNIHVGAWILARSIQALGPTWNAVGGYNAGTRQSHLSEKKRADYARRVEQLYRRLQHSAGAAT